MEKAIILTPKFEALDKEKIQELAEFATERNMVITSVAHYSFMAAMESPKEFAKCLSNELEDNTMYIVADSMLIDINAYSDGVFLEELKKNDIHVFHSRYQQEVTEIWNSMSDGLKQIMKEAVVHALEKMKDNNIMIVTCDEESEDVKKVIEQLKEDEKNHVVGVIELKDYISEMKGVIEHVIKSEAIDEIVLVEQEGISKQLIDDLKVISEKYHCSMHEADYYSPAVQKVRQMLMN